MINIEWIPKAETRKGTNQNIDRAAVTITNSLNPKEVIT